uniref:Uncharacterized protein n=1 Tax=Noctiluca scintillans TaxID=2966 RepID=A0A7S1F281_NOCSC
MVPAQDDDDDEELVEIPAESLPENIMGFAIASFIRDFHAQAVDRSAKHTGLRGVRVSVVLFVVACTWSLQFYIVYATKQLVTPPLVQAIRTAYSDFQNLTYRDDDGTPHLVHSKYGGVRGIPGHYNHNHFQALSAEEQEQVCKISLSQPWFIFTLLFIWGIAVTESLRSTIVLMLRLLLPSATKWKEDMRESVEVNGDTMTVKSLPTCVKFAFCWFLFLPKLLVTFVLLWLGCRFLVATMSFGDVLRNAVALTFILGIPELMFRVLVPMRGRLETTQTHVRSVFSRERANVFTYFGTFSLLFVVGLWVVLYMTWIQDVLPQYNWDVHITCDDYLSHLR